LAALAAPGWGEARGDHATAKGKVVKTLDANAWTIHTSNCGPFAFPQNSAPGGYWGGPGYGYIYGAGLWVGALAGADTQVAVGYNPNNGGSEFGPANPYTWDYASWATDSLSRVYLSTDPADLAAWPLRDAGNNPVVRSLQDGYATYSDQNPAFTFTGETPVGVRVRQSSFAWNDDSGNDAVVFKFTLINPNPGALSGVYAGACFDADIGDESGANANDRTDFDYTRNLAIQFQNEPEPGWPSTGYFGCRFLASALNNTGGTVNVVDNQFPHSIAPGEPLGMTAMKVFSISLDPVTSPNQYLVMQGYDYNTMVMDAYDETGSLVPGDKRFLMCSGPFDLAPGDSVIISLAVMAAPDRASLLALCDSTQVLYNSHLGVTSGKPVADKPPARSLSLTSSPNPFTAMTEIGYQVTVAGPVKLAVYNTLGQRVRILVDRSLPAGSHAARWDGRNDSGQRLPAGVYFYHLSAKDGSAAGGQAGDETLTKKAVMVR
jgi:hypothetical protein